MEDLMLIRSSFMRRIISSAINKAIAKQKYGIKVNLDDIRAEWSDKEQKVKVHLELDAEMPKADLINKEYVTLQGSVKKEIKDQLGRIDISDLREEVKDEAKNQLAESMEDILDDFNDNLKNVKKIYGSISDAITGNQGGKETVVKIS